MLQLPFSEREFLDAFGAYNASLWPAVAVLWIASLSALVLFLRGSQIDRPLSLLLAAHWGWAGIAYHLTFFAAMNSVARLFGEMFLVQALLLGRAGLGQSPIQYSWVSTPRHLIGVLLAAYALVYPFLAMLFVEPYPRTPTFGLPCPTTLFTVGLLMMSTPMRRWLLVIPLLWSFIGGSAALLLGVTTDFVLLFAGLLLLVYMAAPGFLTSDMLPSTPVAAHAIKETGGALSRSSSAH